MPLQDICINLLQVADDILASTDDAKSYVKNGRKYRMTSAGSFVRVQEEDKSLAINLEDPMASTAVYSAYTVLSRMGTVLQDYPELCLCIIATAGQIETQRWVESNSKVVDVSESIYDPFELKEAADEYLQQHPISQSHIDNGCCILAASKINFFHTDHHVGKPKLQGIAMRKIVTIVCGDGNKCLRSEDVYNAIRAFVHWCPISGVLYSIGLTTVSIEPELKEAFASFPQIPDWICDTLHGRYPAGVSQFSLAKKSLQLIAQSTYGTLLSVPQNMVDEIRNVWTLCDSIEKHPERYHIRAKSANLSLEPVTLSNLPDVSRILTLCGCVLYGGKIGTNIVMAARFPKEKTCAQNPYYERVKLLSSILAKNPDYTEEQLVERIGAMKNNFKGLIESL